jgi:hypothetical protein
MKRFGPAHHFKMELGPRLVISWAVRCEFGLREIAKGPALACARVGFERDCSGTPSSTIRTTERVGHSLA